eukprot:CAMPEP_0171076136 /NCGR_PEP_ID=MMETSP0766_2-20121228/13223_1 /TAXON_ID=439317 /ORGANISM="Gambierdiscus australes, Strain CAWD 149" /LENGTH=377 /DNA_ID=CAMNT_0011533075 /DNA_START=65 /DNA_END=1196 /DNA_ORIENTATION=-
MTPGPPRAPGAGAIHFQGTAHGGEAEKMSPGHMQQKMLKHRQAALERQRSASRNRLGASVVAQANPLCQPPPPSILKVPSWRSLVVDGPAAKPAVEGDSAVAGAAPEEVVRASTPGTGRGRGGDRRSMDEVSDCLDVEEIFDKVVQAGAARHSEEETPTPEPRQDLPGLLPSPSNSTMGASLNGAPRRGRSKGTSPPRPNMGGEAWGGAGGFTRAPARPGGDVVVQEMVSDFSMAGERSGFAPQRGRRRSSPPDDADEVQSMGSGAPPKTSWDLDVGTGVQEPEEVSMPSAAAEGGRRGRRWWKPWQGGRASSESKTIPEQDRQDDVASVRPGSRRAAGLTEVTAVSNFTADDDGGLGAMTAVRLCGPHCVWEVEHL